MKAHLWRRGWRAPYFATLLMSWSRVDPKITNMKKPSRSLDTGSLSLRRCRAQSDAIRAQDGRVTREGRREGRSQRQRRGSDGDCSVSTHTCVCAEADAALTSSDGFEIWPRLVTLPATFLSPLTRRRWAVAAETYRCPLRGVDGARAPHAARASVFGAIAKKEMAVARSLLQLSRPRERVCQRAWRKAQS